MMDFIYMLVGLLLTVLVLGAVFVIMVLEKLNERNQPYCCDCCHPCECED